MNQIAARVATLADELTTTATSEREAAVRLHDFVRDGIRFGVTPRFDCATPEQTLSLGVGHCNPQADLFVALCRAVGIEARMHFVLIKLDVLRGIVPREILAVGHHAYVDVRVEDYACRVDSFIIDADLAVAAHAKLREEERPQGYGVHIEGSGDWDGKSDCFSQFASTDMLIEDAGPVDDPEVFYRSDACRNQLLGVPLGRWMTPLWPVTRAILPLVNARIDRIRASASGGASTRERPRAWSSA